MSTTLTNGLKLPDKGSVDWYADMQSNYTILDGAVGTIAEHTTQIAGKAPLVHTHTVSQITDFPAYGTTAGTICEGNDSRLSDARTPVAHTHTKSDVTDLFNSANTWTGDNTFNNAIYSISLRVNNSAYTSGTPSSNVFYNPLSMGGFVNNTWVDPLTINGAIRTNGYNDLSIRVYSQTGNNLMGVLAEINADASIANFRPMARNTYNLGTSTYKWQTLNGINPGALSLPVTALNNTYDISGDITDLTGGNNAITAARTGWIFVKSDSATEISIENTITGMGASDHSAAAATLMVSIPVTSGETLNIIANCTSINKAYLLPCQGNV